jgi:AraC family L-rhamnose operon transcriptional activator RhaR
MAHRTLERSRDVEHFVDGSVAYAARYGHESVEPLHTHSFVEIAVVTAGTGVHVSLAGRQDLAVGDVVLLRPAVWHGYEECRGLGLYNCCISTELQQRELSWTRDDPLLGHLLWTGPYSGQRRGILTAHLDADLLHECLDHLDELNRLRFEPLRLHRGDIVGRLVLFLSCLARVVARDEGGEPGAGEIHPAVLAAMRMMERQPEHAWTLAAGRSCR